MTFALNYKKENSEFNLGSLASRYVGDHFGNLIWGQSLGEALPNHRFYENQGIKTEGSLFAKVNQVVIGPLSGFIDFQLRSINYEVSGEIAGPSSFSVNDNFLFFNPKAGLTLSLIHI